MTVNCMSDERGREGGRERERGGGERRERERVMIIYYSTP